MTTEIVTLPLIGTVTAAEFHLWGVYFLVSFAVAASRLRPALRTDWWYIPLGIACGVLAGYLAAYAIGWL